MEKTLNILLHIVVALAIVLILITLFKLWNEPIRSCKPCTYKQLQTQKCFQNRTQIICEFKQDRS